MKYIVYKTTNIATGQYYIGKHCQLTDEFDGYLGSGIRLKRSVGKYGKENFIRETIGEYTSEAEAYIAEVAILGNLWQDDPLCYNMSSGGHGLGKGFKMSTETRHKMKSRRPGYSHSEETRKKIGQAQAGEKNHMFGSRHSDESKLKISNSLSGKYVAENNSRFNGYYVTPYGRFATIKEIANNIKNISKGTVYNWCKNSDTIITNNMVGVSKFLTSDMVGKTFRAIGFYMEQRNDIGQRG